MDQTVAIQLIFNKKLPFFFSCQKCHQQSKWAKHGIDPHLQPQLADSEAEIFTPGAMNAEVGLFQWPKLGDAKGEMGCRNVWVVQPVWACRLYRRLFHDFRFPNRSSPSFSGPQFDLLTFGCCRCSFKPCRSAQGDHDTIGWHLQRPKADAADGHGGWRSRDGEPRNAFRGEPLVKRCHLPLIPTEPGELGCLLGMASEWLLSSRGNLQVSPENVFWDPSP